MEKIKTRDFRLFWWPQLIAVLAIVASLLFCWIPIVNIAVIIVACLVILGATIFVAVYRFYFYYQLSLDINAVCEGDGLESPSYLYVAVLNGLTFGIYGWFWIYKVAQRLQANAPRYGFKMVIGGKEMLVLDKLSFGWISAWEFVRNMNAFAKEYNKSQGVPEMVGGAR